MDYKLRIFALCFQHYRKALYNALNIDLNTSERVINRERKNRRFYF